MDFPHAFIRDHAPMCPRFLKTCSHCISHDLTSIGEFAIDLICRLVIYCDSPDIGFDMTKPYKTLVVHRLSSDFLGIFQHSQALLRDEPRTASITAATNLSNWVPRNDLISNKNFNLNRFDLFVFLVFLFGVWSAHLYSQHQSTFFLRMKSSRTLEDR